MPKKVLTTPPALQQTRIPAVQRAVKVIQARLTSLSSTPALPDEDQLEILRKKISLSIEKVKRQMHEKGLNIATLAPGDLNAYRWLNFLCNREKLTNHINSLSTATQQTLVLTTSSTNPLAPSFRPSVSIRFYSTTYLYKVTHRKGQIKILINEAFAGAPAALIADMIYLMIKKRDPEKLAAVRKYARQPAFIQNYEILYTRRSLVKSPAGEYYHLQDVFERVNSQYFDAKMAPPRLGWSSRKSRNKFGHYQVESDTVVINRALDAPHIPQYVVDFVMYHELLHKQIGTKTQNGRRQVHTTIFRTAEKQFEFYKEALFFINNFVRTG